MILSNFLLISLLAAFTVANPVSLEIFSEPKDAHPNIVSELSRQYNLNLKKPEGNVLHDNIKVFTLRADPNTGNPIRDPWTRAKHVRDKIESNIFIDPDNLAAIHIGHLGSKVKGFVDGNFLHVTGNTSKLMERRQRQNTNRTDFLDSGRKLTYSNINLMNYDFCDGIVELAIVADKEFGDLFHHDPEKILEFFTIAFWDISLRFKTLTSCAVSFRITSLTVTTDLASQPFIENARSESGTTEQGRILGHFMSWIYEQMDTMPKFDMALTITGSQTEWLGGLAFGWAACGVDHKKRVHWGVSVVDSGYHDLNGYDWWTVSAMAHEMAHNLGSLHDSDQTSRYLMSGDGGGSDTKRLFFSAESDQQITSFVKSDQAACLRTLDEPNEPVFYAEYPKTLAYSRVDQCRNILNEEQSRLPVEAVDEGTCDYINCRVLNTNGYWQWFRVDPTVDFTPCLYDNLPSTCVRGSCLNPQRPNTVLFKNRGSSKCLQSSSYFSYSALMTVDCSQLQAPPFDKFQYDPDNGTLSLLYLPNQGTELGFKFVINHGEYTLTVASEMESPSIISPEELKWRFEWTQDVNGKKAAAACTLLQNVGAQLCAKDEEGIVKMEECNQNDEYQLWETIVG